MLSDNSRPFSPMVKTFQSRKMPGTFSKIETHKPNLDLRHFNQVIGVDNKNNNRHGEGMTTFYDLVRCHVTVQIDAPGCARAKVHYRRGGHCRA